MKNKCDAWEQEFINQMVKLNGSTLRYFFNEYSFFAFSLKHSEVESSKGIVSAIKKGLGQGTTVSDEDLKKILHVFSFASLATKPFANACLYSSKYVSVLEILTISARESGVLTDSMLFQEYDRLNLVSQSHDARVSANYCVMATVIMQWLNTEAHKASQEFPVSKPLTNILSSSLILYADYMGDAVSKPEKQFAKDKKTKMVVGKVG